MQRKRGGRVTDEWKADRAGHMRRPGVNVLCLLRERLVVLLIGFGLVGISLCLLHKSLPKLKWWYRRLLGTRP